MDILGGAQIFEKAMDAAALRQRVISNNIANANTVGFAPSRVAFEEEYRKAYAAENDKDEFAVCADFSDPELGVVGTPSRLADVQPRVVQQGGKLDINQEMIDLAKNQIIYQALAKQASGRLGGIKYIIENFSR